MASLSVYTTVILVCPAVLERAQLSTTPSSSSSGTTLATTTTKQNAITAALATSFSSTPTVTSSFPTSTSSVTQAETARLTASAVLPSSAPSYVLVPIHTTVSIDVFPSNLPPGSREGYVPTYEAHRDGSLTTALFDAKVDKQYLELSVIGVYLCIFTYTLWKSFSYLRRAGPRARSVFGVLLTSQLLGVVAILSVALGFYDSTANCQAINLVAAISAEVSYALIITGILGFKVYRILSRPPLVLFALALFQAISMGLFIADLPQMKGSRSFTGECQPSHKLHYIPYSMVTLFIEAMFITGCFLFAIHKTRWSAPTEHRSTASWWGRNDRRRSSGGAGNLSPTSAAPRSFSDTPSVRQSIGNKLNRALHLTRPWFVANRPDSIVPSKRKNSDIVSAGDVAAAVRSNSQRSGGSRAHRFTRMSDDPEPSPAREAGNGPSNRNSNVNSTSSGVVRERMTRTSGIEETPRSFPFPQATPEPDVVNTDNEKSSPSVHIHTESPDPDELGRVRPRPRPGAGAANRARLSSVRTISTRIIHSSRTIFRRVLKDELLSSAAISIVILISTLASFLGTWGGRLLIGPSLLLDGGWILTSLLILRSFGGVIRRAERSALLREHWENMNAHRGRAAAFDPTGRMQPDTLSDLVFASPEDLPDDEFDVGLGLGRESRIRWEAPYLDSERGGGVDIDAWRRLPRHSTTTGTHSFSASFSLSNPSAPQHHGNGEVSPRGTRRKPGKVSPPSFSSFSSYWASRSDGLDALRRASVVQSLVHVVPHDLDVHPELEHEHDIEVEYGYALGGEGEGEESTPMPGVPMIRSRPGHGSNQPPAPAPSRADGYVAADASSVMARTEPATPSPRPFELRHSRAISAPVLLNTTEKTSSAAGR